jgi:hypothetical protein
MASNAETTAITRALLALLTAIGELNEAISKLAPPQDEQVFGHLVASNKARDQCLENIKTVVDLMEKSRE